MFNSFTSFRIFIIKTLDKIWEGFLQNIGVVICLALISFGAFILNYIKNLQVWIREIPTDYILIPFLLMIVFIINLFSANRKLKKQLNKLELSPIKAKRRFRFLTHYGVWWKIIPDADYIEDFPYCSCCESRMKLVQIEDYPDEVFQCSNTLTKYKLYDNGQIERSRALRTLYYTLFQSFSRQFRELYSTEMNRIKNLFPDIEDESLTHKLFNLDPLKCIPKDKVTEIIDNHPNPMRAYYFVERNFASYRKYFEILKE